MTQAATAIRYQRHNDNHPVLPVMNNTRSSGFSSFRRTPVLLAILAALGCLISALPASAATLYLEPFLNTTGNEKAISWLDGWTVQKATDATDVTADNRIQTANGPSDTPGVVYIYPTTIGYVARGSGITNNQDNPGAGIPLASVGAISVDVVQAKEKGSVTFLIQIDNGDWFISTQPIVPSHSFGNWAAWEAAGSPDIKERLVFSTSRTAWQKFELASSGIITTALSADLTGTAITGIGWLAKSGGDTYNYIRMDNLAIEAAAIPEPATTAAVLAGVVALASLARRRS
ncbi:PEP-CTERM putative exosortase interaction domain-containing protein [Opitutaceae bacterium TAV1]|nr:PEP-CTERM putative exosortase interaction domain-containing protein [Opitutaceae bacterium TAV1]